MNILAIILLTLFVLWSIHGLIEYRRDRRFRGTSRYTLHENWRQVPPPNWASSRRRSGSDSNLW